MKPITSDTRTKKGNIAYSEPGGGCIYAEGIRIQIETTRVVGG